MGKLGKVRLVGNKFNSQNNPLLKKKLNLKEINQNSESLIFVFST